jgi:hypothetical protein
MWIMAYSTIVALWQALRRLTIALAIVIACASSLRAAAADSNSIGILITSDREPNDFADPKSSKYELNGAHTFANGWNFGGSFQYNTDAFRDRRSQNLEGTIGYRASLNSALAAFGSAGLGEHWHQNPGTEFPYYVLRVGADLDLNHSVTWNVITFRHRDGFNPSDHYNTPQVATGLSFKLDEQRTVVTKIMRNWHDGSPSSTGVALGFKQGF